MGPFDRDPFILLNLAFSRRAAYAAPLIFPLQTRQADREHAITARNSPISILSGRLFRANLVAAAIAVTLLPFAPILRLWQYKIGSTIIGPRAGSPDPTIAGVHFFRDLTRSRGS